MSTLPTESDHRMRDGTVHPVQVGLRLVEELRMRCKDSVEEDPLEAVAVEEVWGLWQPGGWL